MFVVMIQQMHRHFSNAISEFSLNESPLRHQTILSPPERLAEQIISELRAPILNSSKRMEAGSSWTQKESERLREEFTSALTGQLLQRQDQPFNSRRLAAREVIKFVRHFCGFTDSQDDLHFRNRPASPPLLGWIRQKPYAGQTVRHGFKLQLKPALSCDAETRFAAATHPLFLSRPRYKELSDFMPADCKLMAPPCHDQNNFSFIMGNQAAIDTVDFTDDLRKAEYKPIKSIVDLVFGDIICYRRDSLDRNYSHAAFAISGATVISRWGYGPVVLHKLDQLPPSFLNPYSGSWQIHRKQT